MKGSNTIDKKEISTILINAIVIKLFFTFPKRLMENAGNAAWIQMIYLTVAACAVFLFISFMYRGCGSLSIIGLSEKIGGKSMKKTVGVLVSISLGLNLASTMRSYPETVKMVLLPNTPLELILIIFAVTVSVAALGGVEAIARIHSIFVPIVSVILTVFFVLLLYHAKIYNIFPILGKGTLNIFVKGIGSIDFFNDILILNLLLPKIQNIKEAKRSGFTAIIVSGADMVFVLLLYCLIYPNPSSEKNLVPIYQLTRLVEVGDFFQRFEAFFEFVWSFSILLYSSLYIWLICDVWRESFDLEYEKPLIFPMMATVTILSFKLHTMHRLLFDDKFLSGFVSFISFVLPVIIPVLYKIKMTKKGNEEII